MHHCKAKLRDEKMKFFIAVIAVLSLTACVADRRVQTIQAGDYQLSCDILQYELDQLEKDFTAAKNDTGIRGIIIDDFRTGMNKESIIDRIIHLMELRANKCPDDIRP